MGSLLEALGRSDFHVAFLQVLKTATPTQLRCLPHRQPLPCSVRHGAGRSLPLSYDSGGFSLNLYLQVRSETLGNSSR
jgi:hypothetical protein